MAVLKQVGGPHQKAFGEKKMKSRTLIDRKQQAGDLTTDKSELFAHERAEEKTNIKPWRDRAKKERESSLRRKCIICDVRGILSQKKEYTGRRKINSHYVRPEREKVKRVSPRCSTRLLEAERSQLGRRSRWI